LADPVIAVPPETEWSWLTSTLDLQTVTYGYDYASMDTEALAEYLTWNKFAADQELAEAAVEWSWAPWASDKPFVNRERVRNELIDVLHFVGNMLTALGVTDAELAEAYARKQQINRDRVASKSYSKQKGGLGDGSD
jgi:dimeric dUTPase (all-alpha-NTP-PPase superfamily)